MLVSANFLTQQMGNKKKVPNILGENIFYVKMGPTGGAKGYSKITGLRSSGICYYINDKLIPELTVERGQTYTFVVETGESTADPAR